MSILFVNGSPNGHGNTASMAKAMLKGKDYNTLNLTDYTIQPYGPRQTPDQFDEVLTKMREADVLVMGSPVYWHNICGSMRNLLDRFYGPVSSGEFSGKKLAFIFQGAAPEDWMYDAGEYTMSRFAGLYGMEYLGMASSRHEAETLGEKIK